VDGDDGIQAVVLTRQQGLRLEALDLGAQGVQVDADLGQNILPFLGQLEVGAEVAEPTLQPLVRLERRLESLTLRQGLSLGVLPEVGMVYLLFEGFDLAA
jgi:hypothetical protein